MKEEIQYGFGKNLKFMWREHWCFDKSFLILLLCQIPLHVGASFLSLFVAKSVLDGLESCESLQRLLVEIVVLAGGLAIFRILDAKISIALDERSWKFFYYYGYEKINNKRMQVDYSHYTSSAGKLSAQKALNAVGDYTFSSIVAFLINLKNCVMNLLGFASFSAILITLHPLTLILMLISYAANMGIILFIERRKEGLHNEESDIRVKKRFFTQKAVHIEYAKDIRIYGIAGWLINLQKILTKKELAVSSKRERFSFVQLMLQGFLTFVRDGIAYAYLIHSFVQDPSMSIGLFALYLGTIAGFGNWLSEMIDSIKELFEANGYVRDFRQFMDLDNDEQMSDGLSLSTDGLHGIRLEGVNFAYPGAEEAILKDITLEIKPGENLALVGLNGAGKTTLIKLICGLLRPTSGKIYIDGVDTCKMGRDTCFHFFSAVFQEAALIPASVAENVAFKHDITEEDRERIYACLEMAGILERINRLPEGIDTQLLPQFSKDAVSLSGGETQKIFLARALYRDAPILILDEPTSALDPISECELYQKYMSLMTNKTSIYISHRLGSTLFCDRIAVLKDTRLVELGSHEELMKKDGWYRELYKLSVKYYKEGDECDV